ncbi:alkaline phosphatase [Staphylococcus chromogenes]|uniref:alkaline phosphatase n=1 Tax=Staphylococcus chromogenes TaxID=46126 RepID=UPI000E6870AF|nr:alkaline phosphatase [Staphylococcus chromogenes]MCE4966505.1 alkaline phosphatase [Staphylococcus chromogenes]MDU0476142.1 alkaline phosphatase [Staphylococcus chromogenes]MEB7450588.1 alkaline phosphatase [Staphylococcus chromogenes]RIM07663.1 alkaline phosphatase [Staphylococcus chromogenes]
MKLTNRFSKVTLASTLIASSLFVTPGVNAEEQKSTTGEKKEAAVYGNTKNPKNIIFMVGDGLGPSYNSAYRHFADNPNTKEVERTVFDEHLVGAHQTHPEDPKENITDSAAGGTAFSTGVKTYNGAIGVDNDKKDLETVLERAKSQGKSTGLVSTAEITDATPAAFAANVDSRDKKNEIAQQYYDQRINGQHKVDVLLGGGAKYFGKENGNLDQKFKKSGYDVVTDKAQLTASKKDKVLGLFADKNMPLQIDAPDKNPLLVDMQQAALDKLSKNDKGFFLMVEGASIDKQGHANDVTGVMSEMESYEKAFEQAIAYANNHPDTLVVSTADHSTGGLSMGKDGEYNWKPEPIRQMKHSGRWMVEQIEAGKSVEDTINAGYGFEITKKEMKHIQKEAKKLKRLNKDKDKDRYETQLQALYTAIQKPVDDQSLTGWTSTGHTGEDVDIYAHGPGAEHFRGNIDNTDNAKNMFEMLGGK